MAICKRNNCESLIGQLPDERKLRLCSDHYQLRLFNADRRAIKRGLTCQYPPCGKSLSNTRNHRYCCNEHRNKARRLIDDNGIVNLVKHSYWLNVESMLKNNPLGLGSINSPDDITNLIRLYQRKATHQKAYNTINGRRVTNSIKRLIPWLELELCHIYPNSKGGSNTVENIIIAPALINRKMKDSVPTDNFSKKLSGIKGVRPSTPVKSTLLKALIEQYGQIEVQEALFPAKQVTFASAEVSHSLFGTNIYTNPPLLKLLKEETSRLGLEQLRDSINHIENNAYISAGPAKELFAVASFHAMLNGDKDHFIYTFSGLRENIMFQTKYKRSLNYDYYQNILDQYMSNYFNLDLHDQEACNIFYNSFFSVPPLNKYGVLVTP